MLFRSSKSIPRFSLNIQSQCPYNNAALENFERISLKNGLTPVEIRGKTV